MARIPVYKRQIDLGLSANLPYLKPDPGVITAMRRADEAIAGGIQSMAQFVQKTSIISAENEANRAVTEFKVSQPVFDKQVRDQHTANPQGYYQAWSEGTKERIDKTIEGMSGLAKRKTEVALRTFHAGEVEVQFNYGAEKTFDKMRADADETMRIAVGDAAVEPDIVKANLKLQGAITNLNQLGDQGVYSPTEVIAETNKALDTFEYTRAYSLVYDPEQPQGPMLFRARVEEGEYNHVDPTKLQQLVKASQVEERRRIKEGAAAATKKAKDDKDQRDAQMAKIQGDLFNQLHGLIDADPTLPEWRDKTQAYIERVDALANARMIKPEPAERYKLAMIKERRAEDYNHDVFNDLMEDAYFSRGSVAEQKEKLWAAFERDDITPTIFKQLNADMKQYHFTSEPGWNQAVKLINNQFGVAGMSIIASQEKASRELMRQQALRTLWENAKKDEGSLNHVELANRLVDQQAERLGSRERLNMPIGPGSSEEKRTRDRKKKKKEGRK